MEFQQEIINPQELAFNNPIILTQILNNNPIPLKDARLVSQFWNSAVLSLPNTKLALNLHPQNDPLPPNPDLVPFFETTSTFDARLARHISPTCPFTTCTDEPRHIYSFAYKLLHFSDKFSDRIQTLEIFLAYENCLKFVHQVVKNCGPALKQYRLTCKFQTSTDLDLTPENKLILESSLQQKPNLTSFSLSSNMVTPFLTSLAQVVVNSAPNLGEVTLPWGFYPDLANSKGITSLTITLYGVHLKTIPSAKTYLSHLTRMLTQVRDQLISLYFSCLDSTSGIKGTDEEINTHSGFQIPNRMIKLRKFVNEFVDIFPCEDLLQGNISGLETLVLGKAFIESTRMDELFKKVNDTNNILENVKNLTLSGVHDPKLLDDPKLDLRRFFGSNVMGPARVTFPLALKACIGWEKLKHLNLAVPSQYNFWIL
ncbi:uncharacterized protein LOC110855079 [Folsomia candida]|uniref:uncharacterized protein LOC110855079 n=1 Tax=Folsomia candida TaxID=158441 RepID=UPI001604D667|nr:uncharacterized protein LOC110855079 [Folsomia candida]XP_035711676.1 uncharacterized protein LOC110855079 [Folsomia candida]